MRNLLYSILVCFAIFLLPTTCLSDTPDKLLHKKCLYPTIGLTSSSGASGSGFIVRSSKIGDEYHNVFLTAAHVANVLDKPIVKVFKYEDWSNIKQIVFYPAVFYFKDLTTDISIGVFISTEEMPVVTIDIQAKFYIGNDVFRIGCGNDASPRLDHGKITSINSNISPTILQGNIRTSIYTIKGDSGGPLFNNEYKLIGICRAIRHYNNIDHYNMSYHVPITSLKKISEEIDDGYDFLWSNQPLPRIVFWELSFRRNYEFKMSQ